MPGTHITNTTTKNDKELKGKIHNPEMPNGYPDVAPPSDEKDKRNHANAHDNATPRRTTPELGTPQAPDDDPNGNTHYVTGIAPDASTRKASWPQPTTYGQRHTAIILS